MEPEEVLEQEETVETPQVAPLVVHTGGEWMLLERITNQEMENGKTYHIKVSGHCQFMISKDKPTFGMVTNEITYTKQPDMNLWIKTGE